MKYIKYITAVLFYLFFDSLWGAFFGFLIGGFISFKLSGGLIGKLSGFGNVGGITGIKTETQSVFFQTVFTLMGKLAKADGRVSEVEIAHVEKFMTQLNMSSKNRKQAINHFQTGASADYQIDALIEKFINVSTSSNLKQMLMVYLLRVAAADGKLAQQEMDLIKDISQKLGYNEQQFAQLMAMLQGQDQFAGGQYGGSASNYRSVDAIAAAYQALGVSKDDSDSDIKKTYRRLVREYHPDKLMGQGLPEEMIKEATERSQEIQTAYDTIKKSRSI